MNEGRREGKKEGRKERTGNNERVYKVGILKLKMNNIRDNWRGERRGRDEGERKIIKNSQSENKLNQLENDEERQVKKVSGKKKENDEKNKI